ncbi:AAA family ATPase [Pseudomonas juntendi]|uniref:AAA family ATPase n=1 Tax=Pseudomonas juntendi TaxID=2666183 RepID=UPI0034D420EB
MKLSVEGYKSIASKQELSFDGLTILAGANSSGKSSFMQPFLILKQTIENHYDSGALVLYGENAKLTDSSQIISKVPNYDSQSFSVCMDKGPESCAASYVYKEEAGLQINRIYATGKNHPKGLELTLSTSSEAIDSAIVANEFNIVREYYKKLKDQPTWKAVREKCFLKAEFSVDKGFSPFRAGIEPAAPLAEFITKLIHVPGVRGNPERTYKIAASDDIYPGSFEKYIASLIKDWSIGTKHKAKYKTLQSQLVDLGLASHITASKVDDTSVEIKVSRNKTGPESDCVNIADVGFGVSQTLPLLVALLAAQKGQPVYIEQPELHLHPKAQFKLASVIIAAVNRGVRVIIETHSSILIRGIQLAVAKKQLNSKKVSLNWFTQDCETGETKVDQAGLDEQGAFGDWPEDFDETSLKVEQMYLDAVEESLS